MLFNSWLFLFAFLPVALAGAALVRRVGPRGPMVWLLLASVVFYGWSNPDRTPLLVLSVLGNFAVASCLWRLTQRPIHATSVLWAGIGLNLAALFWFKLGADALPLGISFFTFTQIAYLLDCHAGTEPRRSALEYGFFVAFFPHLIAGPILRAREIMPQLPGLRLSANNFAVGGGIFVIGLLKKTLLADPLGATVDAGFLAPEELSAFAAWHAALAWSLQIYFDFSGYSDMAIGLARMFNLTYPQNFDSPYKARSIIDYWRRWHMSLTAFLTSAIYTPLALGTMRWRRARGLRADRAAQRSFTGFATMLLWPLTATMTLAGIWHGIGWTFLVFGLLHAGFLAVNHAWRLYRPNPGNSVILPVALTYLCVLAGAIVFRAPTLDAAWTMFGAMLGQTGIVATVSPRGVLDALWITGLFAVVWAAPNTCQIMSQEQNLHWSLLSWRPTLPWAAAFGCAVVLGLLSAGGAGEFVYFQF